MGRTGPRPSARCPPSGRTTRQSHRMRSRPSSGSSTSRRGACIFHQMPQEVVPNLLLHEDAIFLLTRHMALVREDTQVVRRARGGEGVEQPGGVPEMDVFVNQTVD